MKQFLLGAIATVAMTAAAPPAEAADFAVYRPDQAGVATETVGYRIPRAAVNRSFRQLNRQVDRNVRSFQRDVRQFDRNVSRSINRYHAPAPRYYAPAPSYYYAPTPSYYYAPRNSVHLGGFGVYW